MNTSTSFASATTLVLVAAALLAQGWPSHTALGQSPATVPAPAPTAAPARTPAPAPTDTPPDSLLDQAAVVKDARGLTAVKYPDADTVLVSEHQRTQYKPDGSYVTLDDEYVKVLTEAGRKGSREQQFGFDASYRRPHRRWHHVHGCRHGAVLPARRRHHVHLRGRGGRAHGNRQRPLR